MTVTSGMVSELRRMIDELTDETYSDAILEEYIGKFPKIDELGSIPYEYVLVGGIPTKTWNASWIASYDLNAAASGIWREKAAKVSHRFDFNADGGDYKRSQEFQHCDSMSRFFLARSSIKTITQVIAIDENSSDVSWVGNLPESD